MIQFEYDGVMKRYEVKVPQIIAGEHSMLTIAYISEDNRMTLLREMKVEFVRNLLLQWDEYEYQMTRELDGLISEEDREYARWELEHDLAKSIDELEFSTRVHNTMQWLGIKTVGELTKKKACELLKFKSFGRKSLTEVEDKLLGLSLTLKQ
tara:strand:+ start:51 stop:506 length:456 start_codon:yes stop_codon:yes gene_type:complete